MNPVDLSEPHPSTTFHEKHVVLRSGRSTYFRDVLSIEENDAIKVFGEVSQDQVIPC